MQRLGDCVGVDDNGVEEENRDDEDGDDNVDEDDEDGGDNLFFYLTIVWLLLSY